MPRGRPKGISMSISIWKPIAVVVSAAAGAIAFAAHATGWPHILGTRQADVPSARSPSEPPRSLVVHPFRTYANANYATGGVALRNRSEGVIHVSGATGALQDAWLYFAYLYRSPPPSTVRVALTRQFPLPVTALTLRAKLIATSADPCWASQGGAIYRAQVPVSLANGNGEYKIAPDSSVVGLDTGEDPWDGNYLLTLDEGATLVLIGTGPSIVDLFDKRLAGNEFGGTTFNYKLALSAPTTGSVEVEMDSFGADGQIGTARQTNNLDPAETVTVNGYQISGRGVPDGPFDPDSDWNGSSGFPLPQLWDDVGHEITVAAPRGTSQLAVSINSPDDCIITVGNVVSY